VPATLLAVDDSVTMRKVFEMTFAGEDFRVVTADNADAALALIKKENPSLVLADTTLPGKSGYDLCAAIKRDNPGLPVLLLSSKLNPYDKSRGQTAKADDYIDKPFDTQKLIDKVNGLLSGEKKTVVTQGAPKAVSAPYRAPAALNATLVGQGPVKPLAPKSPAVTAPGLSPQPVNLRATADFATRPAPGPSARAPMPPSTTAAASPAPPAVQAKPAAPRVPPAAPAISAKVAPAAPATSAPAKPALQIRPDQDLTAKLDALGLTKDQIDGVLLLSHDLVERVVWEVVPVLAETIIKEELKRLTEEG
jgi:DNA-binding response OmpR family regulator